MVDSIALNSYMVSNNLAPKVLENLGCEHIRDCGKEWRSTRPTGDNPNALSTNKETLHIYCYTTNTSYNIYTLVMNTLNLTFGQAIKYLHSLFGLEYNFNDINIIPKTNILDVFTRYKNREMDINNNEELLSIEPINYIPHLHMNWIKEGITERTREKFNIQYDGGKRKIIIPHTYWEDGRLVGIMSRTTLPNPEMFGMPKYYPIIPYAKGNNLYGLYENYETIIKNGYVVVYESEKSVLKRYSLHDGTGVACCTHSVTDTQAKILISLGVDIIISWDKDVGDDDIFKACNKFKGIRNVYYTKDLNNDLGDKDSIADAPNDVFNKILTNKIKYDIIRV